MKRRDFIKNTSLLTATPFVIGGLSVTANSSPVLETLAKKANAEDKILILIQLVGGNDGLNTVIPLDKYDKLYNARENIIIDEKKTLKLTDSVGLHPVMTGMKTLWDECKLAVVQNVSYPSQNFSHFRSTDIWTSASEADKYVSSGWIGRYLNNLHPQFPENYPNDDYQDPLSITVGSLVSQTCQGPIFSMGLALNSATNFVDLNKNPDEDKLDSEYGKELNYVRTVIAQTEKYVDVLQNAIDKSNVDDNIWSDLNFNLANQLKIVAQLLSGGIKTKVFVCSIGGFDTHSTQISDENDTSIGAHANLLAQVSSSIYAFQKQIEATGISDKVVGMTFSEFGRRIISNSSLGTDHGSAAPMFVFGDSINAGIYGNNPDIPDNVDVSSNLEMEFDFRDIYSTVLRDWFEVNNSQLNEIMFREFDILPLFKTTSVKNNTSNIDAVRVYPNPASNKTNLKFFTKAGGVKIELFDMSGRKVADIFNSYLGNGEHNIDINLLKINNGQYLIKVSDEKGLFNSVKLIVNK